MNCLNIVRTVAVYKSFLMLIFILMLSSMSLALGLSPAEKTIAYEPLKSVEFEFFVINSEANAMNVTLSSSGSLSGSTFFEQTSLELRPENYRTPFKVALKMPADLSPGLHVAYIKLSPVISGSGGSLSAFVSPQVPIYVRVPYPEKYAEVKLLIYPVDEGSPVPFNLQFDNLGIEDIEHAGGSVTVNDLDGKLLSLVKLPSISVPANSFAKTEIQSVLGLPAGKYIATVDSFYDSQDVNFNQSFTIGRPSVEINRVAPTDFRVGEISRFTFDAKLFWNEPLDANVFIIVNGVEQEMPSVRLEPQKSQSIQAFVDGNGVSVGKQDLIVRFVFGSQIKDYKFRVDFYPEGAFIASKMSILTLGAYALGVLILIFIIATLLRRGRKINKKDVSEQDINSLLSSISGKSAANEKGGKNDIVPAAPVYDGKKEKKDLKGSGDTEKSDGESNKKNYAPKEKDEDYAKSFEDEEVAEDDEEEHEDEEDEKEKEKDDEYTPDMDHPLGFTKDEIEEHKPK